LLAVACIAAAGCVGSAPSTHYYRPVVGGPPQTRASTPHLDGVLSITRFTADGLVGDRAIVHTDTEGLEVRPYLYHLWTAPPTEMLQEQLARYLEAANVAATVVTAGARIRHRYVILGRINRFELVSGRDGNRVVVELRLTVSDDSAGRVLWNETYLSEATPADETVAAAVEAFSRALDDVFARFTGDVVALRAGS
jgi:ABC-type uncharacterized transport system auxiliary subunit